MPSTSALPQQPSTSHGNELGQSSSLACSIPNNNIDPGVNHQLLRTMDGTGIKLVPENAVIPQPRQQPPPRIPSQARQLTDVGFPPENTPPTRTYSTNRSTESRGKRSSSSSSSSKSSKSDDRKKKK